MPDSPGDAGDGACTLRVRGLVQGVGFRPTVWRIANALGLAGEVCNDGGGVLISLYGPAQRIEQLIGQLHAQCPPLARIDAIERLAAPDGYPAHAGFRIAPSRDSQMRTGVGPDAATCSACRQDIADPANRRYRYAFTNCTHCGPRFSIVSAVPYDRANTSMRDFALCASCRHEYTDPGDRRFHAQPNACADCGPQLQLCDAQGLAIDCDDPVTEAARRLRRGDILAIKGIGGFHLACDAGNAAAVQELRVRKQRPAKPLAMMARDLAQLRTFSRVGAAEAALLDSPAAPILVLPATDLSRLPAAIAPRQRHWAWMLPHSPLHQLLMAELSGPIVLTSGNRSEEPQCIDNQDALARLGGIADGFLLHDRAIVNRIDDSLARHWDGHTQLLRRARGYAPSRLALPPGFGSGEGILALGGELKNTFCLLKDGAAVLSQHMGDLEEARTFDDYRHNIGLYRALYQFNPKLLACDAHTGYRSHRYARDWAEREQLTLCTVQHHHAHIASCLGDNQVPLEQPAVLGVVLDGLGMGEGGELWGGEIMLADYRSCRRLARLRPVALIGGEQAMREPWRNTYAQLQACGLWPTLAERHPLLHALQRHPLEAAQLMLARGLNCPRASSAGRLFDAVAAALAICPDRLSYEGQAAMALEALVDETSLGSEPAYPFAITAHEDLLEIDPGPMWQALLDDLLQDVAAAAIAMRFHQGLAGVLSRLCGQLCEAHGCEQVALSGGVFQNLTLLRLLRDALQAQGLSVLIQRQLPANDGGLAFGQALVAAAQLQQG